MSLLMGYHVILYTHSDVSIQVAVEMPFKIRTIESPTHKLRIKVHKSLLLSLCSVLLCVVDYTYVCVTYVKHC